MTEIDRRHKMIEKIAEFMGLKILEKREDFGAVVRESPRGAEYAFAPTRDWNDCMLVEERLREKGLWGKYISALVEIVSSSPINEMPIGSNVVAMSNVMAATLEQRMEAAGLVIDLSI